jgi:basic amino acid/polyamine antiporter, APA family
VAAPPSISLVRAIGRWSLAALVINSVVGSGIFGLPANISLHLGDGAPWAYAIATLGMGVIMAAFAELAMQFPGSGGPYLYARDTFGRLTGIQVGWFAYLVRVTSGAANATLFVVYLGQFWPAATGPGTRALVLIVLIALFAIVNVRGVKSGARLSDTLAIAKVLPIALFAVVGLWYVGANVHVEVSGAPASDWFQAVLALVFAFGGFEAAMMPMAEVKDPRRDAPFALFVGLAVVAVAYLSVQLVVMGAFTDPSAFQRADVQARPVAEAARVFMGGPGASLIALLVLFSTFGNLALQFLASPRLLFAFGEHGDFPRVLARVHPKYRTPHVAVLLHAALVCAFAIFGSFIWNAILSAVARLVTYAVVCAAVLALRRRDPNASRPRLPGGQLMAIVGLAFSVVLVTQMEAAHAAIAASVTLAATVNWLWATRAGARVDSQNERHT